MQLKLIFTRNKKRFALLVHSNWESVNRILMTNGFCSLVFGSAHVIVLGVYKDPYEGVLSDVTQRFSPQFRDNPKKTR